jgi:hypothetical protein
LPIYVAARYSNLNVVELLIELYPESVSETEGNGNGMNLLHAALDDDDVRKDEVPFNVRVQYICDHHPNLLQTSSEAGLTPLHFYVLHEEQLDFQPIFIMCEADKTIVRQICQLAT